MSGPNRNMLDHILAHKRTEVRNLMGAGVLAELRGQARDATPPRDFLAALREAPGAAVIAEIKRGSPSAGTLRRNADPPALAAAYETGGAVAISVLTDRRFFFGSLADLRAVKRASSLPVLRKDFMVHPTQIYEARAAGADAILLIVAALEPAELAEMHGLALELGLTALVEVHAEAELETALGLGPELVGVNNRDLATFEINLETCLKLRKLIPSGVTVVAESGIAGPGDVARLRAGGLDAFLIGTLLMREDDPAAMLRELIQEEVG